MFVTLNISTKITVLRREKLGAFKHSSIFNNSVAETFLPHLLFNVSNGIYLKGYIERDQCHKMDEGNFYLIES